MIRVPFQERKTTLRGCIDLLTGSYPRFLFGGSPDKNIPVFHFHEVTKEYLEPYLQYLAENNYKTITSEQISDVFNKGIRPDTKSVALCFDDAWSSLWTVATPLLKKYGLTAITYAIPGLVENSDKTRPTINDGISEPHKADRSNVPFSTWTELRSMQSSGIIDVQSHTYTHAMMFCSRIVIDFITPETKIPLLSRPVINFDRRPEFIKNKMLGAPLYLLRSRMSDAVRYIDDKQTSEACMDCVARNGGVDFFKNPEWRSILLKITKKVSGRFEEEEEKRKAIFNELVKSREELSSQLRTNTIRQICFPWAVCSPLAEKLAKKAGYETAVADIMFGKRMLRKKGDPYRIMRLKHQYIPCLPGVGRKNIFQLRLGRR